MISKRTRRSVEPVESLKQAGIAAVKGIDETASVLDTDRVLHLKNLKIDHDGGLVLRKPIAFKSEIPKVVEGLPTPTDVIFSNYIFDNESLLVIRVSDDSTQYVGVTTDGKFNTIRLTGHVWENFSEASWTLPATHSDRATFYRAQALDFSNVSVVNTSTTTILSNVLVDITNEIFKHGDLEEYTDGRTDLCYPNLYKDKYREQGKVIVPRTLILSKSTDYSTGFDLNIVTPDMNYINYSGDIALDVNLDLDNPYSIRDNYDTSAPTVKSIIPYTPVKSTNLNTTPDSANSISIKKDPYDALTIANPAYAKSTKLPNIVDIDISTTPFYTVEYKYAEEISAGFVDIRLQSARCDFHLAIGQDSIEPAYVSLSPNAFNKRTIKVRKESSITYRTAFTSDITNISGDNRSFMSKFIDALGTSPTLWQMLLAAARELGASGTSKDYVDLTRRVNAVVPGADTVGIRLARIGTYLTATFKYEYPVKESDGYVMEEAMQEFIIVKGDRDD